MKKFLEDTGTYMTEAMIDELIMDEDLRQLQKWGHQNHEMFTWLAFVTEEHGELSEAMSDYIFRFGDLQAIKREAVQVATLAIKIACMIDAGLVNEGDEK